MDLPKLLEIGKELNLQGPDLLVFIKQREEADQKLKTEEANIAREERIAERESKREEAEREERIAEREEKREEAKREAKRDELQHEREMLSLRIEADRARAVADESHHIVMESTREVRPSIRAPPLPRFRESEGNIDVYLQRFERYAANEGWEHDCYAIYLSALLEGPTLDIYHRMPLECANDYEALKEALLKRYSFTAQDFRKRFFNSKQANSESAPQFMSRLKHYLFQWIELSKIVPSFEDVMDLLLREQFLCSCPRDLSLFLRERSVKNVSSISEWAEVYTDSRECVGFKPVKDSSNGRQNVQQKGSQPPPKLTEPHFSRPPVTCFLCNKEGHKAVSCPVRGYHPGSSQQRHCRKHTGSCAIKLQVAEDPHECSNQAVLDCGCKLNIQAGRGALAFRNKLNVMTGIVNGQVVKAIRDTGCTTVVVRQNLVHPSQCTGEECLFVMVDNTTWYFPLVRCQVDTPIFAGEVIAVCIPNPISDLIIGNVPGVHQEDPHWKPRKTRLGLNYYSPTCKNKVTTEREALERQLKKLQLDCARHEKRAYAATRKVRDSLQLVEYAVLEKNKDIRENRSMKTELVKLYQEGIVQVMKNTNSRDNLVKRVCNAERSRDEAFTKLDTIRNELDRLKDSTREQKVALKIELNTLHDRNNHLIQEFQLCAEERIESRQRIDVLKRNDIVLKQKRNNSEGKLMQHVAVMQTEQMEMHSLLQRMCAKWKEKCQLVMCKIESQISELRGKFSDQNRRKD